MIKIYITSNKITVVLTNVVINKNNLLFKCINCYIISF